MADNNSYTPHNGIQTLNNFEKKKTIKAFYNWVTFIKYNIFGLDYILTTTADLIEHRKCSFFFATFSITFAGISGARKLFN